MCQCSLCADRFLCGLLGTPEFAEYCRQRDVRLPSGLPARRWDEAIAWWTGVLRGLPDGLREQVEWEQLAVPELATPSGYVHLLAAANGKAPHGDTPACPAAVLRFLLDRPAVFREVYRRHAHREPNVWRAARAAAGSALPDPDQVGDRLSDGIDRLSRRLPGTGGQRCEVTAYRIPGAVYVCARPARSAGGATSLIDMVYYEGHGTVLMRAPWLPDSQANQELDRLGRSALGGQAPALEPGFALERLKEPFRPLPDGDDIVSVRLKALHLRYPARCGQRELRLHTQTSDSASAVEELLRAHGGRRLDELRVCHAVLQFRLRLEGCEKTRLVRLWPDRCDAGQGPFRSRVLAFLRGYGI